MKKLYTLLLTFYSLSIFVMCSDTTTRSIKEREEFCQEFIFKAICYASKNPNKNFLVSIPDNKLYSPLSNPVILKKITATLTDDHKNRFFKKKLVPILVMVHHPFDNKQLLVGFFTGQHAQKFLEQRRQDNRVGASTIIHAGPEVIKMERGVQSLHVSHTLHDQTMTTSIPVSDLDRP